DPFPIFSKKALYAATYWESEDSNVQKSIRPKVDYPSNQFARTLMAKMHNQPLITIGRKHRFFLATIGVFFTGCASVHTTFEASSYRYTNCPRSVQRAVHVGSTDKQEIEKVGGEFIGTFYVDGGSGVEEPALLDKVSLHGAEVGATHYVVASYGAERDNN